MPGKKPNSKNGKPNRKRQTPRSGNSTRRVNPTQRTPRPVYGGNDASSMGLIHKVCGQTDPFCQHAVGAKMFDRSSAPSITIQCRAFATITSDASGYAAWSFSGDPFQGYALAGLTAGAVTSWFAASKPSEWTNFISPNMLQYRIVSSGFRLFCTAAPLSASGTLMVATLSDLPSATIGMTISSNLYTEVARYTIAGHESVWHSKPVSAGQYTEYVNVAAGNGSNGVTNALVYIAGAPASTSMLSVEMIWNVECTPDTNNGMARMATPAFRHVSQIEDAASNTTAKIPSSYKGGIEAFGQLVVRAAKGAVTQLALDTIGRVPLIGGSLKEGARHGMIMDVN